jgi:hypothetical protein
VVEDWNVVGTDGPEPVEDLCTIPLEDVNDADESAELVGMDTLSVAEWCGVAFSAELREGS